MAVTRKFLTGLGLSAEQQDSVLEAHTETLNDIRAERDRYKADADKLADVQKQLDSANQQLTTLRSEASANGDWKAKHDAVKEEFEKFKADSAAEKTLAAKQTAFRELLKDANVQEQYRDKVLKYTDLSGVELDDKGKIKSAAALMKSVRAEWPEYVETVTEEGAPPVNSPSNIGGGGKTAKDILAIKDDAEMIRAIEDNPGAFGLT